MITDYKTIQIIMYKPFQCNIKWIITLRFNFHVHTNIHYTFIYKLTLYQLIFSVGIVDMILEMGMTDLPTGINISKGMCGETKSLNKKYTSAAYSINRDTMLTAGTSQIFPDGFPIDFSILLSFRANPCNARLPLFSIYSDESEEVLTISVGTSVGFYYQDTDGNPIGDNLINFDVNVDDAR